MSGRGARERAAEAKRAAGAKRNRGAEAESGADAGEASEGAELPAPPVHPPAFAEDAATIRVREERPHDRAEPYFEARVYVHGVERSRTVGTSRQAALGGAYAALVSHWLMSR